MSSDAAAFGAPPDRSERAAAVGMLAATALIYLVFGGYAVINGRVWLDEVTYVIKSWWYVTGVVQPYSDQDATWYMPLYFYQLGVAQKLFGAGYEVGRMMSMVFGALSAGLVFAICRRLNVSLFVSAVAVALYLLTPTTAYYFATVTPMASVAFLLVLAIYLMVRHARHARFAVSAAMGLLMCLLFFYRQNMFLAIAVLIPLYLYMIGRDRWRQGAVLGLAGLAASAVIVSIFPDKLFFYAIRLPLLTPILDRLSLLPENFSLIENASTSVYSLGFEPDRLTWQDPVNAFVLPYLGTILLAAGVFFVRDRRRFICIAAAFFYLAATHYLGSVGYCSACILTYTNYFVAVGIIAAAVTLDALWRAGGGRGWRPLCAVGGITIAALIFNVFGTAFTVRAPGGWLSPYRWFPFTLVERSNGLPELELTRRLSRIIATSTAPGGRALIIHDQPALAYAAFLAGKTMPVQVLNFRPSYRQLRAGLSGDDRSRVLRAIEAEAFWTDEIMRAWLENGISTVLYEEGTIPLAPDAREVLVRDYVLRANVVFQGRNVGIYERRLSAVPKS